MVKFHTFKTIVVVVRGFSEKRRARRVGLQGVAEIGQKLYEIGYDAMIYEQKHDGEIIPFARNRVREEVKDAIERRGVQFIAGIGFSYGAGKLRWAIDSFQNHPKLTAAVNPVTIPYTCYFDAFEPIGFVPASVSGRPVGSEYHLNFYQQVSNGFRGEPTNAAPPAITVNVDATCIVNAQLVLRPDWKPHMWFDKIPSLVNGVAKDGDTAYQVPPCDAVPQVTVTGAGLPAKVPNR